MSTAGQSLVRNANLLKARATKPAILGVVISLSALVIATLLSSYFHYGELSAESIMLAQKNNMVLWVMDGMPFIFAFWGQYVSSILAYEAGAMIIDQTEELRHHTVALERKVMHDATHDALTGLPNRILLRDRLDQALNAAYAARGKLAVMILDLDQFKEINDTLGHYNGDKLLKQLAIRLGGVVREPCTLARLGGDEFAVVLPTISSRKEVEEIVGKIQKALAPPCMLEGLTLEVRMSIGAVISPEHGSDSDTLLKRADVAMYVAKQDRRGFVLYSSKLDQYSPQRLTLMGELRHAIERDELVLHYQPKVESVSNRVTGAEALVRWMHPKHGMMAPDEFIGLAERTGLIKELSVWVINRALQQSARWLYEGNQICISVNISAQDLLDPDFPDMIAGMLASHDVTAGHLVLELTETAIIIDPERALQVLNRIAEMGVKVSVDDFGTGYSSLSYLRKMPVSEVKIDKSFVMEMLEDANDAVIVNAIIGLAHSLGLQVVAEGVESEGILGALKEQGCDLLQGFHLSRPLPVEEFEKWLLAWSEKVVA